MNVEKVKEFGIYNPDKILYPVGALSFTGAGCISGVVTGFEIKNCVYNYIEFNK